MAYDIDKVAKIIADLQNDGLSEAEIRVRLSQAGLPDDVMDKALATLATAKAPVKTSDSLPIEVPAPSSLISKKQVIPDATPSATNLIAKTPIVTPRVPKSTTLVSKPVVKQPDTTNMGVLKAMATSAPKSTSWK